MFGRRKRATASELITPELIQLIAVSRVETDAKNAVAAERWGIGASQRWSADLSEGTMSFHFDERTLVGPVQVLGTYGTATSSWMWGWGNASLPTVVTSASRGTLAHGEAIGMRALTTAQLPVAPEFGDDLASITVALNDLAGLYRAPTKTGFIYLGFSSFD